MIATATVRDGGRVTIPAETRRELGLEPGDPVIIKLQPVSEEADIE